MYWANAKRVTAVQCIYALANANTNAKKKKKNKKYLITKDHTGVKLQFSYVDVLN